jgi:hypothetical protein
VAHLLFFFLPPFPSIGMHYGQGWNGVVELGHEWAKGMESKAAICLDGMQKDGHYEM